ncbi:MAG: cell wall/surface repeat protein, partial [Paenibacillus sp.]|nr:cell wall/surface repeat protein [Paenibacillus sp.]
KNYSAVPATANSANNVLFATPNAAEVGETISLTAAGHRQAEEGNVIGDERYVPEAWASDDEKSGTFSIIGTAYTSSYTPDVVGFTKVTATFQKQTWDGEVWNNTGSPIKKQVIISVSAVKSYTMAAIGDQTLMELTEDYISGSQETKAIRITLTGTGDLAGLSVSLSGANADDFAVTQPILTTLNSISTNTTFTVKAKDDLAIGTYTATVTVSATKMTPAVSFTVGQTVIAPSPPAPPQQLTAAGGDRQAALSWSTVSGATYYNLYMGTETSQYGTEPIETVTGTTYNVLNLLNGTTYYFMVKAGNAVGLSGASNEASAAPRTVPGTPTNIVAIAGDRQAIVTFLPPADHGGSPITGYEVSVSPGDTVAAGTTSPITVSGLTNGTSYTFTVKAINVAGSGLPSAASNSIMPVEPVVVTIEEKQTTSTGIEVLINGKVENAGTASTVEVEGRRVTTIVVDKDKLEQRLAAEADHAVITIPIKIDSEVIIGELDGSMVKSMEEKQAIIEIRTARATYTLPAQLIDIDEISRQMGSSIQLKDIRIRIQIATPSSDMMKVAEAAAIQGTFTLVVPPVDFTVSGTHGETTVDVPKFHAYVLRTVAIPEGVDPNQITTGVVVEADGTVRHVPTKVIVVDGSYYAQISSLTNSTYSVVWHPVEFSDVADHWAKEAVNDMGSRMVVDGAGEGLFNPDLSVTRAEFAAIVVRGLGLKLEQGAAIFKDVHAADWYNSSVRTAYVNGLIEGFEDGSFRPSDRITREQAMVVIARAMAITELKKNSASDLVDGSLLQFADAEQISEWAKGAMSQALQAELVSGRSGGMLAPKADLTRAEVAAIVQRLLHKSGLI